MQGISFLIWAKPMLDIDLMKTMLAPDHIAALGRSLGASVRSLKLGSTNLAKDGKDLSGVEVFCSRLQDASELIVLDFSSNSLGVDAAQLLANGVKGHQSLQSLRCVYVGTRVELYS